MVLGQLDAAQALPELSNEFQCQACMVCFDNHGNLARHCQNRPSDSSCHKWYKEAYLPDLYYQGISVHARLQRALEASDSHHEGGEGDISMNNGEIEQSGGDHLPQDQDFAEFGYGGSGGSGFDWGGDWDEEEVEEVEDEDEGDEDEGEGEDLETGGGAEQQVPFDSWDDEWGAGEGPEQDNQDSYDQQAEDDIIGFLSSLASRLTIQNRSNETTSGGETMAEAVPFSRITRSEYFPDAGRVVGQGLTFLQNWRQKDAHAELRDQRPYHPFNSLDEWQFSNLLFRLPCSLNWKTELLSTSMLKKASLCYRTAQAVSRLIDTLPSGPLWKVQRITYPGYTTAEPIILYYRDPAECVEFILSNPVFDGHLQYVPVRHYGEDGRIVTEPISAKQAWDTQAKLPEGATRIGVILASDATLLTAGTGDLSAHPLMLSIDNLDSSIRRKSSNHSFLLTALLPKPRFIGISNKHVKRTIRDRVFHDCIRHVLKPLREVAQTGKQMADSSGNIRNCFTVLSAYMVDQPEALRLAGVIGNTSPVSLAKSKHLGDHYRHRPRNFSRTRAELDRIAATVDPFTNVETFARRCYDSRLTGVVDLLWDDWPHAEPSAALSFDILHSGHKFWSDHILEWCINALGEEEIDRRFRLLTPRIGWKHFSKGVARLAKTGGRDHRNMQRYILCVIDGAPGVPPSFFELVRSHLDYFYMAQAGEVSTPTLRSILALISEMHDKKEVVHEKGYRESEGWKIPKLEFQHHIVPSIISLGNLMGLSTDIPEHEHIQLVKEPFRRTNHRDFFPQMTQYLDRLERLRYFDLATSMLSSSNSNHGDDEDGSQQTIQNLSGARRPDFTDYFSHLQIMASTGNSEANRVRTFSISSYTVLHLNRDPDIKSITIDEAARLFKLPDLLDAIRDFIYLQTHGRNANISHSGSVLRRCNENQRRYSDECELGFSSIRVWWNIKVQNRSLQHPGTVKKAATLCAQPPDASSGWKLGRCDFALLLNDALAAFDGKANLKDHTVGQLRLIFQPIAEGTRSSSRSGSDYLMYAFRFDPTSSDGRCNPKTGLFRLKRATSNRDNAPLRRLGSVVQVFHIRSAVHVAPCFGGVANPSGQYTEKTMLEASSLLNLNKYSDKETFELLREPPQT